MDIRSGLIGLAAGAGLTYALLMWGQNIEVALNPREAASKLGAELMARVGAKFVHVVGSDADGYFFYDQPKPIGHFLCRTNEYAVPTKIIAQRETRPQEFWDDNLKMATRYGVWRAPVSVPYTDVARETACKTYWGFDRLIAASDGLVAEWGVHLMDEAGNKARKGKVDFAVSCIDARDGQYRCDGLALLKSIDVTTITNVRTISEGKQATEGINQRTDEVTVAIEPIQTDHPEDLTYTIRSLQKYGGPVGYADITAIDIKYERY